MKIFTLRVEWGGLGDHLFYSHIPRIAKEVGGYDKFYLHVSSPFRHEDYRQIWDRNPFVDGLGRMDAHPETTNPAGIPGANMLDMHMLQLGLDDGTRGHEPEFHYSPRRIAAYGGFTVYDPNFVSGVGKINTDHLRETLAAEGANVELCYRGGPFRMAGYSMDGKEYWAAAPRQLVTPRLEDYCDLIFSCKRFICLASGGATLAAALGVPALVLYGEGQPPIFHHSKLHEYRKV